MQKIYKFPSIERFHNKCVMARSVPIGMQDFLVKPKLHGTNVSIILPPGKAEHSQVQGRRNTFSLDQDHYGFAKWWFESENVHQVENKTDYTIVIVGEWCGRGIQKKDAITKLPRKIFAVFALYYYDDNVYELVNGAVRPKPVKVLTEPSMIEMVLRALGYRDFSDTKIIDVVKTMSFNFNDTDHVETAKHVLSEMVEDTAKKDAWVYERFGIEGPGEGFVICPRTEDPELYARWTFKVKTAAHEGKNGKSSVSSSPTVSPTVAHFVGQFANEARFEQAVEELGGREVMTTKYIGPFLKWVSQDILKESKDELVASKLAWKDVSKPITHASREWFLKNFS